LSTIPIAAQRAARENLVDDVVADTDHAARRLAARLSKIEPAGISDAKRYTARLWPEPDLLEGIAVAEFSRLLSAPAVRDRIRDFADRRLMPWEAR
jgi:polyketide biosynthesis enoyl-CoA hydratase PksH